MPQSEVTQPSATSSKTGRSVDSHRLVMETLECHEERERDCAPCTQGNSGYGHGSSHRVQPNSRANHECSPEHRFSGVDGQHPFTRAGGSYGDETLFVAKAAGTDEHQLGGLGQNCCPWATRDGSRIEYSANAPGGRV